MKRIFCTLLAFLLVLSLAACGGQPAETAQAETTGETIAETTVPETTKPDTLIPMDPVILLDTDQCYVEVNGYDLEREPGYLYLQATVTNKTQSLLCFIGRIETNGLALDYSVYTEAAAGETVTDSFAIFVEDAERLGVDPVTDVAVTPIVYFDNVYEDQTVYETVHVCPYGQEDAYTLEWQPEENDIVLFDTKDAAAYILGFEPSAVKAQFLGINLMLVNKTETDIIFFSPTFMTYRDDGTSYAFSCRVPASGVAAATVGWTEEEYHKRDVTDASQLQTIDFELSVNNLDTMEILGNGTASLFCLEDGTLTPANCDNGHYINPSTYYTSDGVTMRGLCTICKEFYEEPFDADVYIKGVLTDRWVCAGRMDGHVEDMAVYTAAKPGCVLPWLEFIGEDEMCLTLIPGQEGIQGKLELAYVSEGGGSFKLDGQEVTSTIPTYVFNHVVDGKTVGAIRYFAQATIGGGETLQVCIDDGNGYEHTLVFTNNMNVASVLKQAKGTWAYDTAVGGSGLPEGVEDYKITIDENGAATLHFGTDSKAGLAYVDIEMGNFPGQTSSLPENVRTKYTLTVLDDDWNSIATVYIYSYEDFTTYTMEYVDMDTGATIPFVKQSD